MYCDERITQTTFALDFLFGERLLMEAPKYCPICQEPPTEFCDCERSDMYCANEHVWFVCDECGALTIALSVSQPTNSHQQTK